MPGPAPCSALETCLPTTRPLLTFEPSERHTRNASRQTIRWRRAAGSRPGRLEKLVPKISRKIRRRCLSTAAEDSVRERYPAAAARGSRDCLDWRYWFLDLR